ncbi:MAG: FeS assembly system protein [Acidobacteria bacterium]|nr:FeS assembly system protein [Acidobacteriota bacterium]
MAENTSDPVAALSLKPAVIGVLSDIYDPEIPVNIWELGLIYDVSVDAQARVQIQMTLTAPGCPAAQALPVEVEQRVREVPGVKDVCVEVVWEPAWTTDRMSEAARLQLGMF